jgi:hypothetical protein
MTRTLLSFGFVAACTLGLAAQPPSTPAQTQPAPPPDGTTVTVTGCLRTGDTPGSFVLTNVKWHSTNGPSKDAAAHHDTTPQRDRPTTPATAATAERDQPNPGETLRLAGAASKLKLDAHVGHTVTATGMVAPPDPIVRPAVILPETPPRGDTTSRQRESPGAPPASFPRVLNMRSFTHVAAQCS